MRARGYERRTPGNRRIAVIVSAVVAAGALAVGTGMSYAGQNGAAGNATRAAAVANPNCSLVVPPNPLSATGLATPYQLVATNPNQGACHEADSAQAAFVQASVVDPATGKVSVYNPLVVDGGTRPAVAPVVPALPRGAVVGIWFGFNGDNLTLADSRGSLRAGVCVNGLANSTFTQFAYCNAPAFFTAANGAIRAGRLKVPPLGTGKDGNPCPSTRDFTIVDQDQSDNVTTAYLINGQTVAQDTAAGRAKLPNATVQVNGSDNLLLVQFVDQAVGCTPFRAPDLADNGTPTTSLALDELQAAAGQGNPVALVPPNDPMAQVNGRSNATKLNLYRRGVDMPAVGNAGALAAPYCQNMVSLTPKRLQQDRRFTQQVGSPDPAAASNLFTFLAQRLSASFGNLGCANLIKSGNPVKLTVSNGVATDASFVGLGGPANGGTATGAPAKGGTATGGTATRGTGNGGRKGGRKGRNASVTSTPTATPVSPANPAASAVPSGPNPAASAVPSGPTPTVSASKY